jgi:hypothetical protein
MSTTVDLAFVRQYEAEVHEEFQRQGSKLMNTVRMKDGVVGKSTTFQRVGKGTATSKARHGVVPPMNVVHTPVDCFLEDRYAGDWVDKLDELKLNIQERQITARAGAMALGRDIDDRIIVKLDGTSQTAITYTYTSIATILGSLLAVDEQLTENDVPDDGDRWGLLTPHAWSAAMIVPQFASADFVGGDLPFPGALGRQVRTWLGINWMRHTGLPGMGTATAKGFAYHKTAVGFASGQGITTDITWHGDRAAHFVNNMMSNGACLIEDTGVIELTINDTTALPAS